MDVKNVLHSELSFYGAIVGGVLAVAAFYFLSSAQQAESTNILSKQIALIGQQVQIHIDSTKDEAETIAAVKEKVAILMARIGTINQVQ